MKPSIRTLARVPLALALLLAGVAQAAPHVAHRTSADGTVHFQIRGISEPPARLEIAEIAGGHRLALHEFQFAETESAYSAHWEPDRQEHEGVYSLRLLLADGTTWPRQAPLEIEPPHIESFPAALDRMHDRVTWTPQHTCVARVLGNLRNGMFIRTLKRWHFAAPVPDEAPWDFWDEERLVDYRTTRALTAAILQIPLPPHFLVVGTPSFERYRDHPAFADFDLDPLDLGFLLETDSTPVREHPAFPGREIPVIAPAHRITLTLDEPTRELLHDHDFGVYIYLNGEMLLKETYVTEPWSFSLPPRTAPAESLQILVINVLDHHGGIGARTLPFWFAESGEEP